MHEPPVEQAIPLIKAEASRRQVMIILYGVIAFLYWMALYLYVPTLPTYVQSKSDNLAVVGLVLSMYGLWQAIIRLPLGVAADWLGWRKPFILLGLVLVGLGAWLMGSAQDVQGLGVGRAITGLAAGTWVPLVVVFSSLFPPQEAVRASAMLTLVGSVGRVLATSVTGSLNELGGYSLAFSLAAVAAALAVLIALPIREKPRPARRPSMSSVGSLISRHDVLLPALLNGVNQYAVWAVTFGFLPILARELGTTDVLQSMLVSLHIGITILGNLMATAIVNRIGTPRLIYFSFILLPAGIVGATLATSVPLLFVSQFGIGLATGIAYPVLMGMSIQHVVDAERTTAMGLHQAVYALGMFGGPWVSGWLADMIGIRPMFWVTALLCLVSGLLLNRWLAAKPIEDPAQTRVIIEA